MEDPLKEYEIPFAGLEPGVYEYVFDIDNALFQHFGHDGLKEPKVVVEVKLEKLNTVMTFYFDVKGKALVECNRCGEEVLLEFDGNYKLLVKFGDGQYEETDELYVVPHSEHRINVGQFLYEYTLLSIPSRTVHPDGECNSEVLKRLNELENNQQGEDADPRWSALSKLKDKE